MLEQLKNAKSVVGVKQTKKAVKDGLAQTVFVADDAEQRVIRPIIDLCGETNTTVIHVQSMRELGQACGIEVGASAAAVLIK